jgi:hypothetical protein
LFQVIPQVRAVYIELGGSFMTQHYHEAVVGLLDSLAELDPMLGPTELVCLWYDCLYFPCQNNAHLFNQGVWERGQQEWRECFTETELRALARFHDVFDSVVEDISEDPANFAQDTNWTKVSAAAKTALAEFQK